MSTQDEELQGDRWLENRIGRILYGGSYTTNHRTQPTGRKIRKIVELIDKNFLAYEHSRDFKNQQDRLNNLHSTNNSLEEK